MRHSLHHVAGAGLLLSCLLFTTTHARVKTIQVRSDDVRLTESCILSIPPDASIEDINGNGVIHVEADNIRIRFKRGSILRGAPAGRPWDQLQGIGIRIHGRTNVVLEGIRIHGFKCGVLATRADGLIIHGGDLSDNYRQRLKSTPSSEDGSDWLFPHDNDKEPWRIRHGAAVCVEQSRGVRIHELLVRRGQNGIILDRVNDSELYDNDCSFLSGWGLAMWRSSGNRITRNAFDFCVRGHSEGVYNRGQDSAGILCFEQCNRNVFAENSVTHGGDGFFGFAGREALGESWLESEMNRLSAAGKTVKNRSEVPVPPEIAKQFSRLGCNENLLIGNDFSYASAHGIEMTFSEGNQFVRNRIVENAICGIWGGYSSGTLIQGNEFIRNGGMAYGLERGAINMEHASDNRISANRFLNNRCGIHLWWNENKGLAGLPGVSGGNHQVTGNVISRNEFVINEEAGFPRMGRTERLLLLQLRDTSRGTNLHGNRWFNNTVAITHPAGQEFSFEPGCTVIRAEAADPPREADVQIQGHSRPVGARKRFRGRENIVLDEWGPWDHKSPLLRPSSSKPGTMEYELFGVSRLKQPQILRGNGNIQVTVAASARSGSNRILVQGSPGITPYRARLAGKGYSAELSGTLVATTWDATFFAWTVDPRENLNGWRQESKNGKAVQAKLSGLDFAYGFGGPREMKIPGKFEESAIGTDHFGMIARSRLTIPAGRWRFRTLSDDGIRVKVHNVTVIENWTWHGPTANEGIYDQKSEGEAELLVEHFEIDGYSVLNLAIEPAD